MDILNILNKALNILKSKQELPEYGFLTGGSLANIAWEIVSGNKTNINDIDIFVKSDINYNGEKKFTFNSIEKVLCCDYTGISYHYRNKDNYIIDESLKQGIFNFIKYSSNTSDYQIILDSFDINCCQVGYDLLNEKFYWTDCFVDFLKTGELKLINLTTPSHSAIRLVKKHKELNTNFPESELDIITFALKNRFMDQNRLRFKDKYKDLFNKYKDLLESRFDIARDTEKELDLLTNNNIETKLYFLVSKEDLLKINKDVKEVSSIMDCIPQNSFKDIYLSTDFLYWYRNIYNKYEDLWNSFKYIINTKIKIEDYIDIKPSEEQFNFLTKLINVSPKVVNNLLGLTLSKQIYLIEKLFKKFENDPIIALSILENKINLENDLDDDFELLLLELSVRKNILVDRNSSILYILDKTRSIKDKTPTVELAIF